MPRPITCLSFTKEGPITLAHRYIPNQFVKISRGTLNRQPLIIPDKKGEINKSIRTIFVNSAKRCEIEILALHVEPFGYEAIILDRNMKRSDFMQMVNQAISLLMKKKIVHYESLWSNQKPGNLPILDIETLKSQIVKVSTTPVRNGYVRKGKDWELPHFSPADWGIEMMVEEEKADHLQLRKPKPSPDKAGAKGLESALISAVKRHKQGPSHSKVGQLSVRGTTIGTFSLNDDIHVNPQKEEINWCPGLRKLLDGKGSIVDMFAKIDKLKEELSDEIQRFEKEERRRRKRVLGVIACRRKTTFLKSKAPGANIYTDHLRHVLCGSSKRRKNIRKFMKDFFDAYNSALVRFIRTKDAYFPYGILKMRTLFRAKYNAPEDEDPFHFEF